MTDPIATRRWLSGAKASMRQGWAWPGSAWHGKAGQDKTRQGLFTADCPLETVGFRVVTPMRLGGAWQGRARQDKGCLQPTAHWKQWAFGW